jgi:hypothetical protein
MLRRLHQGASPARALRPHLEAANLIPQLVRHPFARCSVAVCASPTFVDVFCAASATPWMLLEIVAAPRAASVTLRDISLVVALCSSTAVAITSRCG